MTQDNLPVKYRPAEVAELHAAILAVFAEWKAWPGPLSSFDVVTVVDAETKDYSLWMQERNEEKTQSLFARLQIRNNKVWIQEDNTEEGIATDLMRYGVIAKQIVLGFRAPKMRGNTEFAVE